MNFIKYCRENFEIEPTEKMIENYNAFVQFHKEHFLKEPSMKLTDSFIDTQLVKEKSNENHSSKRKS